MDITSLKELKEIIKEQLNKLLEENEQDRLKMRLPEINTAICLSVQTLLLLDKEQNTSNIQQNTETDYQPLPKIEIRANEGPTEIYIDGKRLEGVMSFSLEEDPMEDLNPIFKIKMRNCKFDISTTAIPLLPAPWKEFYQVKPKYEGLTDIETLEKEREAKLKKQNEN